MIISKTPVRVSFLGGGSDYPESINKWGGIVLGTTINHFSYITCRVLPPFFDYKSRLMYSKTETINEYCDVEHRVIKKCLERYGPQDHRVEICHISDLPSSSGTGSSSTFVVGLLNALFALRGLSYTSYDLYKDACKIEQNELKEHVGCQDQAWAAFGGLNTIEFHKNGEIDIKKIYLPADNLKFFNDTLVLFFTRIYRSSSDIASTYVSTLLEKEKEHLDLVRLAHKGLDAIHNRRYLDLGNIMHESWDIKKSLSSTITNEKIDKMFDAAMSAGARGGKLMGAGGGGCLIFSVPPAQKNEVIHSVEYYGGLHIPFKFESAGSKIILGEK